MPSALLDRLIPVLTGGSIDRESSWTESVAVGSPKFLYEVKVHFGIKVIGRKILEQGRILSVTGESSAAYNADFGAEKGCLSLQNTYFGGISLTIPVSYLGPTPALPPALSGYNVDQLRKAYLRKDQGR